MLQGQHDSFVIATWLLLLFRDGLRLCNQVRLESKSQTYHRVLIMKTISIILPSYLALGKIFDPWLCSTMSVDRKSISKA